MSSHQGPRLPYFLHVKRFSSVDQAFETPMDTLLYKQVKVPLAELLGGHLYSQRTVTHSGYTIGKLGWHTQNYTDFFSLVFQELHEVVNLNSACFVLPHPIVAVLTDDDVCFSDVEICLDEGGYVLPLSHWEHTHRRQDTFCTDNYFHVEPNENAQSLTCLELREHNNPDCFS